MNRTLFAVALLLLSCAALAQSTQPTTAPATQPLNVSEMTDEQKQEIRKKLMESLQPKKVVAKVSPAAKAELDALSTAYDALKSLDLAGTLNVHFDVNGDVRKETAGFVASYQSPNRFKHTMRDEAAKKDDLIVGSTGEKAYLFAPEQKMYLQNDAPKTKADYNKTRSQVASAIMQQNPSLRLALSEKPAEVLLEDATEVNKLDDVKIGEQAFTALMINSEAADMRVLIDPKSHLVRQVQVDLSRELKRQGAPEVKAAVATFDYTTIAPDAEVKADQFAWAPPEGAKDAATMQQGNGEEAAMALVGKPAPEFTLAGMDDKDVALKDLKGSVVVLDFWATWCGPCVASMPGLEKMHVAHKDAGLKVLAVNQAEDKKTIADFMKAKELTMPVLLDPGKVAEAYGVTGIPQTVLIGKDGVVKKVYIGFGPGGHTELEKLVEEELAKK